MITASNAVRTSGSRSCPQDSASRSSMVGGPLSTETKLRSSGHAVTHDTSKIEGPQAEIVVLDERAADYIVAELENVRAQCERELARQDLYPNVRDRLFKRKRALEDTARMFTGTRSRARRKREAYEATGSRQRDRIVFRPIRERDNVYKELPPGILRRVVRGAGGVENVRWPEGHAYLSDEPTAATDTALVSGSDMQGDSAVEEQLQALLAEHLGSVPGQLTVALSKYVDSLMDEAFVAGQRGKKRASEA